MYEMTYSRWYIGEGGLRPTELILDLYATLVSDGWGKPVHKLRTARAQATVSCTALYPTIQTVGINPVFIPAFSRFHNTSFSTYLHTLFTLFGRALYTLSTRPIISCCQNKRINLDLNKEHS